MLSVVHFLSMAEAVSPRDLVGAGAVPASASHAADAAAGNGLLQTPRGTEVRPLAPWNAVRFVSGIFWLMFFLNKKCLVMEYM